MRIKAVGFDVGETLVTYAETPLNWAALYRPALERVARAIAVRPSEPALAAAEQVLRHYNTRLRARTVEVSADAIFDEVLAVWEAGSVSRKADAIAAFFGFFQQRLRAYDDTLPALTTLSEQPLRMGALTDVPYGMPRAFVEADLQQAGVLAHLQVLITSVEVGFRKPDPRGFLALAARLGVAPSEMVYVGNEPKDIEGANAAGLCSVLIARPGVESPPPAREAARPHGTVRHLGELSGRLRDLEAG